jgi:four helix bundle protein
VKSHKDLDVWKKSIELVVDLYKTTKNFPKEEIYGLTSQIRRSAVSVSSNIAEGAARKGKREFKQFLFTALGSLAELETQLIITLEIEYIDKTLFNKLNAEIVEIRKMLLGLIKYLEA